MSAVAMAQGTGIEWTHVPGFKGETWNPVTGCSKVSAGCKHCYAEREFPRLVGNPKLKAYPAGRKFTDVMCHSERLELPLRWRKPRAVFVNSMSDLFHEDVPIRFIAEVFNTMASGLLTCRKVDCDHEYGEDCFVENPHIFMVLTKRHKRMLEILRPGGELDQEVAENWPGDSPISSAMEDGEKFKTWPLPNVWLGVSVEDQATADKRIPILLQVPAAKRFVSYEPALAEVDFTRIDYTAKLQAMMRDVARKEGWDEEKTVGPPPSADCRAKVNALSGHWFDGWDSGADGEKLDWVIVGGESGPDARPMHPDWARSARDQCEAAGVPFFLK